MLESFQVSEEFADQSITELLLVDGSAIFERWKTEKQGLRLVEGWIAAGERFLSQCTLGPEKQIGCCANLCAGRQAEPDRATQITVQELLQRTRNHIPQSACGLL